jgi:hypothetical protein
VRGADFLLHGVCCSGVRCPFTCGHVFTHCHVLLCRTAVLSLLIPLTASPPHSDDEAGGDGSLVNKAEKKRAEKQAAADAKEMAKEGKRLLDIEKAEAAKLAAEDAEDAK